MSLANLVVLDIATLGAAPQIAAFLGDFGARVIKVEPPRGDGLRRLVDRTGTALHWKIINRNKEMITLDYTRPPGRALLDRLLDRADVLICAHSRERLERLGLDAASLAKHHPRLICVNLTAYGTTGPWSDREGSGTLAEAMGGLAGLTGAADGPPTLSPVGLGDYMGVLQGIIATLLALYERDRGAGADAERAAGQGASMPESAAADAERGRGEMIDVAMYEPILGLLAQRIAAWTRERVEPGRHGNRFPNVAPRNTYRTADGEWVALTAGTDDLSRRLFSVIGAPELAEDPRFRDNLSRVDHVDELDAIIGAWIGARSRDQVVEAFAAARVSLAAVDSLARVAENPHFHARGNLIEVEDGGEPGERILTAAPSPRRDRDPGQIRHLGRDRGVDNRAVYVDWLGLGEAELDALAREGVI